MRFHAGFGGMMQPLLPGILSGTCACRGCSVNALETHVTRTRGNEDQQRMDWVSRIMGGGDEESKRAAARAKPSGIFGCKRDAKEA